MIINLKEQLGLAQLHCSPSFSMGSIFKDDLPGKNKAIGESKNRQSNMVVNGININEEVP
jgi:hypothetical protein